MLQVKAYQEEILTSIIEDEAWLGKTTMDVPDCALALILAPFVPSPTLALSDLVLATTDEIVDPFVRLGAGIASLVVDDLGNPAIKLDEPAGGFTYAVAGDAPVPIDV